MTDATIVLPTYGRPGPLARCLSALGRLTGGPYPIIVVDDGSPTPVDGICQEAGHNVRYLRQANAGPAAARNRGVAAADTPLVLFIDDDCIAEVGWAIRLIEGHGGREDRLVGGRVADGLPGNPFSSAAQSILTYSYTHFGAFEDRMSFFTTNNLCVSRKRFLALGGFDTNYDFASEDRDFSFRWRQAGGHLHYVESAKVEHYHHMRLPAFVRQQFTYGRGARRFHRRVGELASEGVKLGAARFYAGLLLHPLARPGLRALLCTGLIGLAHAALAAGYAREVLSERDRRTGRQ
jgi:GT2 family glycosyltransferase